MVSSAAVASSDATLALLTPSTTHWSVSGYSACSRAVSQGSSEGRLSPCDMSQVRAAGKEEGR